MMKQIGPVDGQNPSTNYCQYEKHTLILGPMNSGFLSIVIGIWVTSRCTRARVGLSDLKKHLHSSVLNLNVLKMSYSI